MPNIIDVYRDTTCGDVCLLYNETIGIAIDESLLAFEPDNLAGWCEMAVSPSLRELASLNPDDPEDCAYAEEFVCTYFYGINAVEFRKEVDKAGSSLQYLGSYCPSEWVATLFDGVIDLIYDGSSNPSANVAVSPTLH